MKKIQLTTLFISLITLVSCNEDSQNNRYLINDSQKTIFLSRGYDRNNIYSTQEIYPGDTIPIDNQFTTGQWDMQAPMNNENSYYYYGDSIFLNVALPYKINKDFYQFSNWKCFLSNASLLPSTNEYESYFILKESDISL
jgi:hypothetical protein